MTSYKELPFAEEVIELELNLINEAETLKLLKSTVFAIDQLKIELERASDFDSGLSRYDVEEFMHKTRNISYLLQCHTDKLMEIHKMQQEVLNTLFEKVEMDYSCHCDKENSDYLERHLFSDPQDPDFTM